LHNYTDPSNYLLARWDIKDGVATWQGGWDNITPIGMGIDYDKVTDLAVEADPNSPGDVIIVWGDTHNAGLDTFYTYVTAAGQVHEQGLATAPPAANDRIRGVAYNTVTEDTYAAVIHNVHLMQFNETIRRHLAT